MTEKNSIERNRRTVRALDLKMDDATKRAMLTVEIIMLIAILIHDGDHVRQAYQWSYSIPVSLLVLNLVVYLPTFIAIFLTHLRRWSATLVMAFAGLNTGISFAWVHLLGSATGLWGIWNDPYVELGVDWISWVILAEVVFGGILLACIACYYCGRMVQQGHDGGGLSEAENARKAHA